MQCYMNWQTVQHILEKKSAEEKLKKKRSNNTLLIKTVTIGKIGIANY